MVSLPILASSAWLYLAATLFLAIFIFLILKPFSSNRRKGDTILLLGPSDAGKTAILSYLTYGQVLRTHTSMQVNETQFLKEAESKAPIRLVDIPGHPRIRAQFTEHLSSAKGVIFVVDTMTVTRNAMSTAELLHSVLHAITKLPPSAHTPPLLIYANKCDLIAVPRSADRRTVASERVRTILERELEKRRQSSLTGVGVGSLGETGEEDDGVIQGDLETSGEGPFAFARWEGGEISLDGGWIDIDARLNLRNEKSDSENVTGVEGDVDGILSWIDGL